MELKNMNHLEKNFWKSLDTSFFFMEKIKWRVWLETRLRLGWFFRRSLGILVWWFYLSLLMTLCLHLLLLRLFLCRHRRTTVVAWAQIPLRLLALDKNNQPITSTMENYHVRIVSGSGQFVGQGYADLRVKNLMILMLLLLIRHRVFLLVIR